MSNRNCKPAKLRNFSLAFEKMCNFVAIADTRNPDETLNQLILQCFVILPSEKFQNARQFMEITDSLFGLQISEHQIQSCLDRLVKKGDIRCPANTNFTLSPEIREQLQKKIDNAKELEERVQHEWLEEIIRSFPALPFDDLWKALKGYLSRAFRRHGIQTAALLDPSIDIAAEYQESLSFLLEDTLKDTFSGDHRPMAKDAISKFLAAVGDYPDRASYIAQLADGAFNYFSLTVAPDVAEQFRQKLNPLTLFFDTNFLFGILDLHSHSQVEVSNELLQAIEKYQFPFKLRYHQATEKEMISTIGHFGDILRSRKWSQSISRAATTSLCLCGIEVKYHKLNAETGIDVDSFLKPYKHVDILLKDKNILKYMPYEGTLSERADLLADYKSFLAAKGKEKPYGAIEHDTTILDAVRQFRSKAKSSLEAGALLITCDYQLYMFDWENSRIHNKMACTVLPNLFWQILRPFAPSDLDFDRSFAETFAIPEFRTISSDAAKACSKMLSLLAVYKDIPEETAARMLSNDLLINRLRKVDSDEQFQEYVESAIVSENALLLEEKAALANQLESEKAEKEAKLKALDTERTVHEQEKSQVSQLLKQKEQELKSALMQKDKEKERADCAFAEAEKEKAARKLAEEQAAGRVVTINIYAIIASSAISSISIAIFELLVYWLPCNWLRNHPNSYGLQGSFDVLLILVIFGYFLPKWRKWCWGTSGVCAVLGLILTLLGGPSNTVK